MSVKPNTRLQVLVAILGVCVAGAVVHYSRVWYFERQLLVIGHQIVDGYNEEDDYLPLPDQGAQAVVRIETTCSFAYLVFGEKTGKITLHVDARSHAPETGLGGLTYVYSHVEGEWQMVESYHF